MKTTFLHDILELKKARIAKQRKLVDFDELKETARRTRAEAVPHRFRTALEDADSTNIIAEIKRASPSKGVINDSIDVAWMAENYEKGGACAISVLTEEDHFKGSLDDLRGIRAAVSLPLLRKDFIFDEFQIYEAAEAGADVILLIAAMLDNKALVKLYCLAEQHLGMDALVEIHTLEEFKRVRMIDARIVGVNNRDLHTFKVNLDVSRELIKHKSRNSLMISESGIGSREKISELRSLGFDGFLIGETLMRSGDSAEELRKLVAD